MDATKQATPNRLQHFMESTLIFSALSLGFATGFHCIGMCGPIALSMGLSKKQAINFHLQNTTYNLGRIVTYSVLGGVLGILGEGFRLAGLQQYLTLLVGITLVVMAFFSFTKGDFANKIPVLNRLLLQVKIRLGKLLSQKDLKSRFLTGILNGLLPCGMVYVALTASLAAGGVLEGALFMTLFGIGTFPFLFLVVLFGGMLNTALRIKVLKIMPVLMLIMGSLIIIRALELGIPFISPDKQALEVLHNNSPEHNTGDHSTCH